MAEPELVSRARDVAESRMADTPLNRAIAEEVGAVYAPDIDSLPNDPNEARKYLEAPQPVEVPMGLPPAILQEYMREAGQATSPEPTAPSVNEASAVSPQAGALVERAKGYLKAMGKGALGGALIPGIGPIGGAVAGAEGEYGKNQLAAHGDTNDALVQEKLRGGMASPGSPAQPNEIYGEPPPPPGGGGPTIISPGVVGLHSSGKETQNIEESQDMKKLREEAYGLQQQAADTETFYRGVAGSENVRLANERLQKQNELARQDAEFAARAEKIRRESEARITQATQALKDAEVDPNLNPMKQIMEGNDFGKKVMLGLGMLFGSLGAAMTHGPNQFIEMYRDNIGRKVDLLKTRFAQRQAQLGEAKDAYSRMRQALNDDNAARALLEARAWQMLDTKVDQVAKQLELDLNDPRLQELKAGINEKYWEAERTVARTVHSQVAYQEQQKNLIVIPQSGDQDHTPDYIKDVVDAREKKQLPLIESTLDDINAAVSGMSSDPKFRDQAAVIMRTGGGSFKPLARYMAGNKAAFQHLSAALMNYARAKSGTAQTQHELENLATAVGTGSVEALDTFYNIVSNERRNAEADVSTLEGYGEFNRRRRTRAGIPGATEYVPRPPDVPKGAPER